MKSTKLSDEDNLVQVMTPSSSNLVPVADESSQVSAFKTKELKLEHVQVPKLDLKQILAQAKENNASQARLQSLNQGMILGAGQVDSHMVDGSFLTEFQNSEPVV